MEVPGGVYLGDRKAQSLKIKGLARCSERQSEPRRERSGTEQQTRGLAKWGSSHSGAGAFLARPGGRRWSFSKGEFVEPSSGWRDPVHSTRRPAGLEIVMFGSDHNPFIRLETGLGFTGCGKSHRAWQALKTIPQGLKASLILGALLARVKSCPFKTASSMEIFRSLSSHPTTPPASAGGAGRVTAAPGCRLLPA